MKYVYTKSKGTSLLSIECNLGDFPNPRSFVVPYVTLFSGNKSLKTHRHLKLLVPPSMVFRSSNKFRFYRRNPITYRYLGHVNLKPDVLRPYTVHYLRGHYSYLVNFGSPDKLLHCVSLIFFSPFFRDSSIRNTNVQKTKEHQRNLH